MSKRIIIFHYHLNPGGVTRIIESQIESLKNFNSDLDILVVCGDCQNKKKIEALGAKIIVNKLFNYYSNTNPAEITENLNSINNLLKNIIQQGDILHLHNLNLGKNPLITYAFNAYAKKGFSIINHAHDFAEDRPANWNQLTSIIEQQLGCQLNDILYPGFNNYTFAVLNTFDYQRLQALKIDNSRINLVPNPVSFNVSSTYFNKTDILGKLNLPYNKLTITYPVRVIRRKNIGEYILLCSLFSETANWIVTQPPKNPVEIEPYNQWKEFCQHQNIPLCFEAGTKVDFEGLLKSSDFCFTTSIQEGFGMVFMEPWLLGTPVIGRDIPMVTLDLKASGVNYPVLYSKILVGHNGRNTDFATLEMENQMNIIKNIIHNPKIKDTLFEQNPFLKVLLTKIDGQVILENKNIILKEYSLEKFAERLYGIYQKLT